MRAALVLLTVCVLPATAQNRLSKPVIDTVDHHIVRVTNNGPSQWADTNGWKLVLERTVQPADGAPGELANPSQVFIFPDGRVVALEQGFRSPPAIHLFDGAGRFVREIGRAGDGPDEYRSVEGALLGDSLVIHDQRAARTSIVTRDGAFLRTFHSVCCSSGSSVAAASGRVRLKNANTWWFFSTTGKLIDSVKPPQAIKPAAWAYAVPGGKGVTSIPFGGANLYASLSSGLIVYGGTTQTELIVTSTGRDTVAIFRGLQLPAEPLPRILRDSAFHLATDHNPDVARVAKFDDIPATLPLWQHIDADRRDNLWLTLPGTHGTIRGFAVVRPNGVFAGLVPAPFTSAISISVSADHLALLALDADDRPVIRIYRIDRRGK